MPRSGFISDVVEISRHRPATLRVRVTGDKHQVFRFTQLTERLDKCRRALFKLFYRRVCAINRETIHNHPRISAGKTVYRPRPGL